MQTCNFLLLSASSEFQSYLRMHSLKESRFGEARFQRYAELVAESVPGIVLIEKVILRLPT